MTELDDEELELFRAARRQFTPGPEVAARVAASVAGKLAPHGSQAPLAHGMNASSRALSSFRAVLFGRGLAGLSAKAGLVSALALLGLGAGTAWMTLTEPSGRQAAPPRASSTRAPPPPATAASTLPAVVASVPPALVVPPSAVTSALGPSVAVTAHQHHAPARGAEKPPQAPDPVSLPQELAAVHAAELALNDGNPLQALATLDTLGPSTRGSLGEERSALRLLSRCALGGAEQPERVEQFLAQYPRSLYAPRLRRACSK
jgi:hypothetical protein